MTERPEAMTMAQKREDLKDGRGAAEATAGMRGGGAEAEVLTVISRRRQEGSHSGVPGKSGVQEMMPEATAHINTEKTQRESTREINGQK